MTLISLFFTFFKVGLFTVGGGLAALPLLHKALVTDQLLITEETFIDMFAISQSTPGPIGINMATFCGFEAAGIPGACIATAGMAAPSLIIIVLLASIAAAYRKSPAVSAIFSILRPAATGMIAAAAWFILRKSVLLPMQISDTPENALLIFTLFLLLAGAKHKWKTIHPVLFLIAGGILGILLF